LSRRCDAPARSSHPRGTFAGSNLRSTFAIANAWCSPALPTNVYDRSKPFGPQSFISQLSSAREPTIDTRQSPGLSLRACSTSARTSAPTPGSPVLCSSSDTAISVHCTGRDERFGPPSGSDSQGWIRLDHGGNASYPLIALPPVRMLISCAFSNTARGLPSHPSNFYLATWRMRLPFLSSILNPVLTVQERGFC
jgi:hypothetical protein